MPPSSSLQSIPKPRCDQFARGQRAATASKYSVAGSWHGLVRPYTAHIHFHNRIHAHIQVWTARALNDWDPLADWTAVSTWRINATQYVVNQIDALKNQERFTLSPNRDVLTNSRNTMLAELAKMTNKLATVYLDQGQPNVAIHIFKQRYKNPTMEITQALHRHVQSTRAQLALGRPELAQKNIRKNDLHGTFQMNKFPDMYTQMANCYAARIEKRRELDDDNDRKEALA